MIGNHITTPLGLVASSVQDDGPHLGLLRVQFPHAVEVDAIVVRRRDESAPVAHLVERAVTVANREGGLEEEGAAQAQQHCSLDEHGRVDLHVAEADGVVNEALLHDGGDLLVGEPSDGPDLVPEVGVVDLCAPLPLDESELCQIRCG